MRIAPLLAAGLVAATAGTATAADFSDTFIGYRYSSSYTEPGIAQDVPKHIVQLGHFSTYKYGTNFFSLDILRSLENDPACCGPDASQAQELYLTYKHALSYSKVTGSKLSLGPIRDGLLMFGFDAGTKDTRFAPRPLKLVIGPAVSFALPAGFLEVSLLAYKESNNNGIVGREVDFDPTWQLGAAWAVPFTLGTSAVFKGFVSITGEKGKDGFGNDTATETLLRTSVQWDLGVLAGLNKGTVFAGVGYEYWKNKFGNQPSVPGSKTSAPTLHAEWHF